MCTVDYSQEVRAYIVMASIGMAYRGMTYIVMASIGMTAWGEFDEGWRARPTTRKKFEQELDVGGTP